VLQERERKAALVIVVVLLQDLLGASMFLAEGQTKFDPAFVLHAPAPDSVNDEVPLVTVLSPVSQVYSSHNVALIFVVTKPVSWNNEVLPGNITKYEGIITNVEYTLDGLTTSQPVEDVWNSNLPLNLTVDLGNLANGRHILMVRTLGWCLYAPLVYRDRYANFVEGFSGEVVFVIDAPAKINVLLPNETLYRTKSVPLNFTVDEGVSWMGYSLDGEKNVTVFGNTTIEGLVDGSHLVQVFAHVPTGSISGSVTAKFDVQMPPKIVVVSPGINRDYNFTQIPIIFTVNKQTTWMGYSLDGQANVTVNGNSSLLIRSDGDHMIKLYARDVFGNQGSSEMVAFAKFPEIAPIPTRSGMLQARSSYWILIGLVSFAGLFVGVAVVKWKRRKSAFG